MIAVRNKEYQTYEQDIRELLEAFFPGQEITGEESREASFFFDIDALVSGNEEKLTGIRFQDKSLIKELLYDKISRETGMTLPWGTLTGIKPVKLAEKILDGDGRENQEKTRKVLETKYRVSPEKAELVTELAMREKALMQKVPKGRNWSLYAGIPFCPTRCLYCSFTSNPISLWRDRTEEYLDCLEKELSAMRRGGQKLMPATVYAGGGTPTALDAPDLRRFLSILTEQIDMAGTEFTVESGRPDSIDPEKLKIMRDFGVQRISINPQTMNDRTLQVIGRCHTAADTIRAFHEARKAGFDNINMDLIMGLPGEKLSDAEHTLSKIEKLKPDSLTVHTLAVKRAARLSTDHDPWADYERAEGEEAAKMVRMGRELADSLGMVPYYLYRQKNMAGNQDNTGYAIPGKECLYNIIMMDEKQPVAGVGAGSTSKAGKTRYENPKDIRTYLNGTEDIAQRKTFFMDELYKNS